MVQVLKIAEGSTKLLTMERTLDQEYFSWCRNTLMPKRHCQTNGSMTVTIERSTNTCAQPDTNPNPNPTAKQHAVVSIQPNIFTCPTCPDKFIKDDVVAPSVLLSIVIVTLPFVTVYEYRIFFPALYITPSQVLYIYSTD